MFMMLVVKMFMMLDTCVCSVDMLCVVHVTITPPARLMLDPSWYLLKPEVWLGRTI